MTVLKWRTPIASLLAYILAGNAIAVGSAVDRSVDSYVRDEMTKRQIPGLALAVIRHGRIEKLATYGEASLEFSVPVTATTLFSVASVTKTFAAVGIMTLVEAGQLRLDDTVGTYLAELPVSWREVTIRQMLSHTSGLPDILIKHSADPIAETPEATIQLLRDKPMDFAPGSQYQYNQTNYMLLGMLIEKLSGLPYAKFCETRLFAPLKLNGPRFGDTRKLIIGRATIYTPYRFDADGTPTQMDHLDVLNYKSPPMIYPANGLNISVADFANWLVALMNGKVISKASTEMLWTPVRLNDGTLSEFPPSAGPWRSEGLGWLLIPNPIHPAAGGTGGPYAAFVVYPKDELAIAVLTNTQGSQPDSLLDDISRQYLTVSDRASQERNP
jgi:CubicO group peptidase (beta-lactamase class C family)